MWGQPFRTLTPTLQTLTCVPVGFPKPLLNTTDGKLNQTMLLKIIACLLVAGDGDVGQINVWDIYTSSYQVFHDVFRCPSLADFFAGILTALASPSWLWYRADVPALAGPKIAQPSDPQLLSWAIGITMQKWDPCCADQGCGNISNVKMSADCKVNQASNTALEVDIDISVQNNRKGTGRCLR